MAGKHRAPTKTAAERVSAAVVPAAVAAVALATAPTANAAPTNDLDIIAQCESGNRNVPNSSGASTASGYWQIINGTWRAYGGTEFAPRAIHATKAQQRVVAARIVAAEGGYRAWNPSKKCWGSKIGKAPVADTGKRSTGKEAPVKKRAATAAPKHAKALSGGKTYVVRKGDTLSEIALRVYGTSDWRALFKKNSAIIKNPNRIYVGATLNV